MLLGERPNVSAILNFVAAVALVATCSGFFLHMGFIRPFGGALSMALQAGIGLAYIYLLFLAPLSVVLLFFPKIAQMLWNNLFWIALLSAVAYFGVIHFTGSFAKTSFEETQFHWFASLAGALFCGLSIVSFFLSAESVFQPTRATRIRIADCLKLLIIFYSFGSFNIYAGVQQGTLLALRPEKADVVKLDGSPVCGVRSTLIVKTQESTVLHCQFADGLVAPVTIQGSTTILSSGNLRDVLLEPDISPSAFVSPLPFLLDGQDR